MFGEILNSPLKPVTTCGKSSISDVSGFCIHLCINYFRKTIAYLFTKFDYTLFFKQPTILIEPQRCLVFCDCHGNFNFFKFIPDRIYIQMAYNYSF